MVEGSHGKKRFWKIQKEKGQEAEKEEFGKENRNTRNDFKSIVLVSISGALKNYRF